MDASLVASTADAAFGSPVGIDSVVDGGIARESPSVEPPQRRASGPNERRGPPPLATPHVDTRGPRSLGEQSSSRTIHQSLELVQTLLCLCGSPLVYFDVHLPRPCSLPRRPASSTAAACEYFLPEQQWSLRDLFTPEGARIGGRWCSRSPQCDETTRTETMLQSEGDTKAPSSP